jgi:hypothetical protein
VTLLRERLIAMIFMAFGAELNLVVFWAKCGYHRYCLFIGHRFQNKQNLLINILHSGTVAWVPHNQPNAWLPLQWSAARLPQPVAVVLL